MCSKNSDQLPVLNRLTDIFALGKFDYGAMVRYQNLTRKPEHLRAPWARAPLGPGPGTMYLNCREDGGTRSPIEIWVLVNGRKKLLFLAEKTVWISDFSQKKPSDFGEDLFFLEITWFSLKIFLNPIQE